MRKINTLISLIFISIITTIAQDAIFYKVAEGCAPKIDGEVDTIWNKVEKHNIDKNFTWDGLKEHPTLNEATWQAVWNNTAIFILIDVKDDNFCPWWCTGQADWLGDKPEIYFDINVNNLNDGQGPVNYPNGHYLFAPNFYDLGIYSYQICSDDYLGLNFCYAYKVDNPNYVFEYAFPLNTLVNDNNNTIDPSTEPIIGFDVVIIDVDSDNGIRNRAVWMQDGTGNVADESWNNMDDAGEVIFSTQKVGKPKATIYKLPAGCEIVVDGVIDENWSNIEKYIINNIYINENPTYEGASWKAVWNDTIIFILIEFNEFYPPGWNGPPDWHPGIPEIYFDVNSDNLNDGEGPVNEPNGHYIFSVDSANILAPIPYCRDSLKKSYYCFTYHIDKNNMSIKYIFEFGIYLSTLKNKDNITFNPNTNSVIGFDIYYIDLDDSYSDTNRIVWSNTGKIDENIYNMDDAGLLTFSSEELELNCATEIETYQPVSFNIYPIPASEKIYMSNSDKINHLIIYDITGKTINTIENIHSDKLEINIENFEDGVYLIQFIDKKGNLTTQRFLKK